jgi:oxaloacetate decarboxylase gamma subunit
MQASYLDQGVTLMLVGMGTVFVFLTVLVFAMSAMAAIVRRLAPQAEAVASDEEVAAVTAAIAQHRRLNS